MQAFFKVNANFHDRFSHGVSYEEALLSSMPNTTSQQNKVSGKKRYSIFSLLAEKYGKLEKQQLFALQRSQ